MRVCARVFTTLFRRIPKITLPRTVNTAVPVRRARINERERRGEGLSSSFVSRDCRANPRGTITCTAANQLGQISSLKSDHAKGAKTSTYEKALRRRNGSENVVKSGQFVSSIDDNFMLFLTHARTHARIYRDERHVIDRFNGIYCLLLSRPRRKVHGGAGRRRRRRQNLKSRSIRARVST